MYLAARQRGESEQVTRSCLHLDTVVIRRPCEFRYAPNSQFVTRTKGIMASLRNVTHLFWKLTRVFLVLRKRTSPRGVWSFEAGWFLLQASYMQLGALSSMTRYPKCCKQQFTLFVRHLPLFIRISSVVKAERNTKRTPSTHRPHIHLIPGPFMQTRAGDPPLNRHVTAYFTCGNHCHPYPIPRTSRHFSKRLFQFQ